MHVEIKLINKLTGKINWGPNMSMYENIKIMTFAHSESTFQAGPNYKSKDMKNSVRSIYECDLL